MSNYAKKIVNGDRLAGARLIRMIEDNSEERLPIIKELYPYTGKAFVIGITGPPGVGKSTLVDKLITKFREKDNRVGVIVIDPSSPISGGAFLGDRIKMGRHADDPGVFIRSVAARGSSGGLAAGVPEMIWVLEAMDFNLIIVETAGAGQTQVDISYLAHSVGVVNIPEAGDSIQAMKAGILEIGDIFIINKADLPGADIAVQNLEYSINACLEKEPIRRPRPIIKTAAIKNKGINILAGAFLEHYQYLAETGSLKRKRKEQEKFFLTILVKEKLLERLSERIQKSDKYYKFLEDIAEKRIDPHTAASKIVKDKELHNFLCNNW